MAQFTVRNIEDEVKNRLKQRAVRNRTSMEAEVRDILRIAVMDQPKKSAPGLGTRIVSRFTKIGLTKAEALPELRGQKPRPVKVRP
jgi:antitoxin FitA